MIRHILYLFWQCWHLLTHRQEQEDDYAERYNLW